MRSWPGAHQDKGAAVKQPHKLKICGDPDKLRIRGPVVQWIEHHRPKVGVGGSSPSRATKLLLFGVLGKVLVSNFIFEEFFGLEPVLNL